MRTCRHRLARARAGTILPIVALMLVALLGAAALSVECGRLYDQRRVLQAAADTAAEAAGIELYDRYLDFGGVDQDGQARASALAITTAAGYGQAGSNSQVIVNIPPKSGYYAGKAGYAEVVIDSQMPRSFSGIFGTGDLQVEARAVAAGTMFDSKASVLVLDPKRHDALRLKGKNSLLEVGGDIIVNSKNKRAVKAGKRGQIVAERLLVSGGIDRKSRKVIDAEVSTGVDPTPDPLKSLSPPDKGKSLDVKDYKHTSGGKDIYDLVPGTYKELKFNKDAVINMAPGNYFVENGVEFRDSVQVNAQEVMIYNDGKKGFKISASDVTITPPTSGPYEGMSLWQNAKSKSKVEFRKDADLDINGTIYAPNAEVKFKGVDVHTGGYTDDADEEGEEDDGFLDEDGGTSSRGSIGAAIISRKLTIEKGSHVQILGVNIDAQRPLRGLVE